MFSLTIKGLLAHKLRFALTGVAIILGVSFMAGTFVLTDTMGATFDDLFKTSNAGVDAVVKHESKFTTPPGIERERVPGPVLDQVRAVPGVAAAHGSVMGFAQMVGKDGKPMGNPGQGAGTLGTNWIEDPALNPFDIAAGEAPRGADQVLIDRGSATRGDLRLGDRVSVLTQAAPREFTIVGIATFGSADSMAGASLAAFDTDTAQQVLGSPGQFDTITVRAAEGVSQATLVNDIDRAVGRASGTPGLEVISGDQQTATQQQSVQKSLSFFNTFMMSFALISLFVGTFIIYNTFTILVAQRGREMALLRALGARRRQVMGSVIIESIAIGLVASGLGLGFGLLMAKGLEGLLAAIGLELPPGDTVILPRTIIVSMLVGVGVTLVSALIPARKASRIAPIAALRDVAVEQRKGTVLRSVLGTAMVVIGAALFGVGVTGEGDAAVQAIGLGSLLSVMGVFVLGPVIVRPMARVIGWPLAKLGMTGRFARQNTVRNPRRTSATAAALMIGVALVAFISILAASTKSSTVAAVDKAMHSDYVVNGGTHGMGGLATSIEGDLARVEGIETVSPVRLTRAIFVSDFTRAAQKQNADPSVGSPAAVPVAAVDPTTIDAVFDAREVAGNLADLGVDEVAVSENVASAENLRVGDRIEATFAQADGVGLTVHAIYAESLPGDTTSGHIVSIDTYRAHVSSDFDAQVLIKTRPGVAADVSRGRIEAALAAYPNATLEDRAQFKQSVVKEIDMMLNLIYGLLALAIIIALIGIANTLALSVHERTRELGLLRAVGMTRRQVRAAIRWESVIIALLGTVLGFGLGMSGAWGLGMAMRTKGVTAFVVPPGTMTAIAVMAVGAGVLAALAPARRASRLDVLEAIASE